MPTVAEIYCYLDPEFSGDLSHVEGLLKERGHRLLVGEDLDELALLLQLADPTLIIYTLSKEDSILEPSFQMLSKEVLKKSIPMVLIGPGTEIDVFTLYTPRLAGFAATTISIERLQDVVDDLQLQSFVPPSAEFSAPEETGSRLVDLLGQGPEAIEIETTLEVSDHSKIGTTVSRGEALLVREEQTVPNDDPRLDEKMKVQHADAVKAYAPAKSSQVNATSLKYRGEISAPFVVSATGNEARGSTLSEAKWIRPVQVIIAVGALASIGAFLHLSTQSNPSPGNRRAIDVPFETPTKDKEPSSDLPDIAIKPLDAPPDPQYEEFSNEGSAVPFPATFRTGTALFVFLDEWEEKRFVTMIKGVKEDRKIKIIGHPTVEEVSKGKKSLGWSRAWTVHHYLVRKGIPRSRLHTTLGKPVTYEMDKDQYGRERHRFVEILIE